MVTDLQTDYHYMSVAGRQSRILRSARVDRSSFYSSRVGPLQPTLCRWPEPPHPNGQGAQNFDRGRNCKSLGCPTILTCNHDSQTVEPRTRTSGLGDGAHDEDDDDDSNAGDEPQNEDVTMHLSRPEDSIMEDPAPREVIKFLDITRFHSPDYSWVLPFLGSSPEWIHGYMSRMRPNFPEYLENTTSFCRVAFNTLRPIVDEDNCETYVRHLCSHRA